MGYVGGGQSAKVGSETCCQGHHFGGGGAGGGGHACAQSRKVILDGATHGTNVTRNRTMGNNSFYVFFA